MFSSSGFCNEKPLCVLGRNLVRNGFTTIRSHAFNGTKVNTL